VLTRAQLHVLAFALFLQPFPRARCGLTLLPTNSPRHCLLYPSCIRILPAYSLSPNFQGGPRAFRAQQRQMLARESRGDRKRRCRRRRSRREAGRRRSGGRRAQRRGGGRGFAICLSENRFIAKENTSHCPSRACSLHPVGEGGGRGGGEEEECFNHGKNRRKRHAHTLSGDTGAVASTIVNHHSPLGRSWLTELLLRSPPPPHTIPH